MELDRAKAAIEAILFTMGGSVELETIAYAVDEEPASARAIIRSLMDDYEAKMSGLRIIELENSFQMCTKIEYYDYLIRVAASPKKHTLTEVMLETLSIIAYKQPITRVEIEKIRGVSSDHAVNRLVEYNLIEEKGRLNAPGRPILFGTTEEFLRHFGIASIEELPDYQPEVIEEFKEEAYEEIDNNLQLTV